MSSSNRLIPQPSSMKEALSKPQKVTENSIVMKGKIDRTKVDNPAIQSSINKVDNSLSQSSKGINNIILLLYFYIIFYYDD